MTNATECMIHYDDGFVNTFVGGENMKANATIRDYAKSKGVRLWEVARALNFSEPTMTRLLRVELSEDRKSELYNAIDTVAAQHAAQATATAAQ